MSPGEPLNLSSLEDLDRVALAQLHDRLLPAGLARLVQPTALRLRLDHGDVHAQNLDAEQLLDRLPDLDLVCVRVDAERVGVGVLDLRVALLGHDRGEQDLVGMEAHDAFAFTSSSAS